MLYSSIALTIAATSATLALMPQPPKAVPVERLAENAQRYIDQHPDEYRGYYILGRIYLIAWAADIEAIPATLGETPEEQPQLSYYPIGVTRVHHPMTTGKSEYFDKALENYRSALRCARAMEPHEGKHRERVALLGIGWLCERAAQDVAGLRWPFIEDESSDISKRLEHKLSKALQRYNGEPNSRRGRVLFRDIDASLRIAQALNDSASEETRARLGMFAKQIWIVRSLECNKQALLLSDLEDYDPAVLMESEGKQAVRSASGFDHVVNEACASIDIVSGLDKRMLSMYSDLVDYAESVSEWNQRRPRIVTPIICALDDIRPMRSLVDSDRRIAFDLDGDFTVEQWPWVKPDTAFLCWLGDGDVRVKSGRELIGSRTWWVFWDDGYEPLKFLDDDGDGYLRGDELDGLGFWIDANVDGVAGQAELMPVTHHGVHAINVNHNGRIDGVLTSRRGIEMNDGRWLPTYDWEPTEIKGDDY